MADAAQIRATNQRLQALTDRRALRGHAARRSRAATVLVSVVTMVGLIGTFAAGASPVKRRAAGVPRGPGTSSSTVAVGPTATTGLTAPAKTTIATAAGAPPPPSSTSSVAPPRGSATPPTQGSGRAPTSAAPGSTAPAATSPATHPPPAPPVTAAPTTAPHQSPTTTAPPPTTTTTTIATGGS